MTNNSKQCQLSSFILWETGTQHFANDVTVSMVNAITAVLALLGNLVIVLAMKKKNLIKTPCHILICSLTLVDCVASLVAKPLYSVLRFVLHYEHVTCFSLNLLVTVTESAIMFCVGCSLMHMVCIARDRCSALCQPVEYRKPGKIKVASCLACACWVAWGIIVVLFQWIVPELAKSAVRVSLAVVLLASLVAYHVKTFWIVLRYNHSVINDTGTLDAQRLMLREKRVLADARYTCAVFAVLFIPTVVLSIMQPSGVYANGVFPWALTVTLLNSAVNPVIHLWRNRNLRRTIVEMFMPEYE